MSFFRIKDKLSDVNPFKDIIYVKAHEAYEAHKDIIAYMESLKTATPELAATITGCRIDARLPLDVTTGLPKNLTFLQLAAQILQFSQLKDFINTRHRPDIANIDIAIIDEIIKKMRSFPQFKPDAYTVYEKEMQMIHYTGGLLEKIEYHLAKKPIVLQYWIMNLKELLIKSPFSPYLTATSPFDLLPEDEDLRVFRLELHALNEEIKAARPDGNLALHCQGNEHVVLDQFVDHLTDHLQKHVTQGYVPPLVPLYAETIVNRSRSYN
jgi:hypothetical protein